VVMLLVMPNGLVPGRDTERGGTSPAVALLRRLANLPGGAALSGETALSGQDRKQ
jgi:hypothetical protein